MDRNEKIILSVVGALLAAAIIATVAVFFATRQKTVNLFTPPDIEINAVQGTPDTIDENSAYQKVMMSEEFQFSMCLCPAYKGGAVEIYYTSYATNTVNSLVKLYDGEGNLVGESGLIRPGYYLKSILVSDLPADSVVTAKILSYEPETYYSMGTASGKLSLRVAE